MPTWISVTRPVPEALKSAALACRRHFAYAAGFSAVINLLYIAPTIYMLQVYDRVIPTRGVVTLVFLTILLLASLGALSWLEMVRSRLLVRASLRLDNDLSDLFLKANLRQRPGTAPRQVMRDLDVFRQAVTGAGIIAVFDAPWTLVYALLCFVLHPALGTMALAGMGCLIALSIATERATLPRLEKATNVAARAYGSQAQAASVGELIQALGMGGAIVRRQQDERSSLKLLQSDASFAAGRYMSATKFIRLSLQSLGLGLAALLAVGQAISPGAIFAASLLMARALAPLEMLLGSWRSLADARSAFASLCETLEAAPEAPPRTILPAPTGRLAVEGLVIAGAFPDRPILQGVSFTVAPGEVMGLVGASGAGKTTLVRALVGGLIPTRGAVRLDHASLADWDSERLGRHVGYLPQDLGLLTGTVKQNICRFRDACGERAEDLDPRVVAAAQLCGAHEMVLRLPSGYDTLLGHQGAGLSLGQAQRVALARALFDQPRLLILDEPNAHLDGEGETRLLQALARAKAWGAAIVLVAHRATMLPVIDSLLVLQEGRVTHVGPRDDVLEQINAAPRQLTREPKAA